MKAVKPKRRHYTLRMLAAAGRALADMTVLPGVLVVDVYHDDECPRLTCGGECTCDADIGEVRQLLSPTEVQ